jgi:antitoxin VapB
MYFLSYTKILTNIERCNMHKAKLFKNGDSQAVRLPKEFRVKGKEVNIYHLGKSIVLQPIGETWRDVYNELRGLSDEDFNTMTKIEDLPPQEREGL